MKLLAAALVALVAAYPDVTTLAHRATALVHSRHAFRKAVLLEADGTPAKPGTVTTASAIVRWRFVFDNQASGGIYKSATIVATRGHFGRVHGNTQPFLEDQVIRPIPTMTLAQAIGHLNQAGYTQGFSAVVLRRPLYPGVKDAEYIFGMKNGKYVEVDSRTGTVKPVT